jgi:hypothetical protein
MRIYKCVCVYVYIYIYIYVYLFALIKSIWYALSFILYVLLPSPPMNQMCLYLHPTHSFP